MSNAALCVRRSRWGVITITLLALAVAACAPVVLQPLTSQPADPRWFDSEFVMRDGAALPYRAWLPDKGGAPRAIVVAVHGFNDYRRAFELPGPYLASSGFAVFAYDQRGFGAAPGRGLWPGRDLLLADLTDVVALLAQRYPGQPLYLLGDSMGAGVVILAAQLPAIQQHVTGLVLNAPAVWGAETFNVFYRAGLWTLAHTVPGWRVTSRGLKIRVSDNIPLLRALGRDPLMLRGARTDVLYGLVGLMDEALAAASTLPVPTLVLYGLRDEVIPKEAVCGFLAQAAPGTRYRFYPDGYHLLLRDLQAKVVWEDLGAWLTGGGGESADGGMPCEGKT